MPLQLPIVRVSGQDGPVRVLVRLGFKETHRHGRVCLEPKNSIFDEIYNLTVISHWWVAQPLLLHILRLLLTVGVAALVCVSQHPVTKYEDALNALVVRGVAGEFVLVR